MLFGQAEAGEEEEKDLPEQAMPSASFESDVEEHRQEKAQNDVCE